MVARRRAGAAIFETVPSCAVWLRLLVTALLCVAGVARPSAQRSGSSTEAWAADPVQLCAATREGELSRVRKRGADEPDGDSAALVAPERDRSVSGWSDVDPAPARVGQGVCAPLERARARGPPIA